MKCTDAKVGTALRDPDGRLWEVLSMNWALASPPDRLTLMELPNGVNRPSRGEIRKVGDEDLAAWSVAARGR